MVLILSLLFARFLFLVPRHKKNPMASDKNKVIPTEIPIAAISTLESPFNFPENRDLMNMIYHSPYSKKTCD